MANNISGETKSDSNNAYLKKLKEQLAASAAAKLKMQQAAVNAQNKYKLPDAQSILNQTASQKAATAVKFNWKGLSPIGYLDQILNMKQSQGAANAKYSPQQSYLDMYTDWQSPGFLPTAQPGGMNVGPDYIDPAKIYQDNAASYNAYLRGKNYVYGENKSGREPIFTNYRPGQMNTYDDRDILPGNYSPWSPDGTLPPPPTTTPPGNAPQYDYPVYGGYGGSSDSGINQWYANMVQWNINRPKGA